MCSILLKLQSFTKRFQVNSNQNLVIDQFMLSNSDTDFSPQLNIAFAVDQNYLKPCGISIFSILNSQK